MDKVETWIGITLQQIIDFYPEYYNYELYIWDSNEQDKEPFFLGNISQIYDKYKNKHILFTNKTKKSIQLKGTVKDLEII